jgi:hypothetical protein
MTDHTARPESWDYAALRAEADFPYGDCMLELRARVERLEQAQQLPDPAPSTPAGQGELVRSVALAITDDEHDAALWDDEARAAILAVADWLVRFEFIGAASALRREVGR